MPPSSGPANAAIPRASRRWGRLAILVAGVVAFQFALYWPSLVGGKVLLPLELLTDAGVYVPPSLAPMPARSLDETRLDLVLQFEPERQFAARELAAHRRPRWLPYEYGGVPMRFTLLSPLFLFKAATTGPRLIAWAQVLVALIAGTGAYRFFRDALRLSFWPSTLAAWAYSISGFFVLWQGFPVAETACWFPWLLASVTRVMMGASRWPLVGTSFFTAMELVSGQLDVGVLALGTAAVYAIAGQFAHARSGDPAQETRHRQTVRRRSALLGAFTGLAMGVLVASPYVLPYVEYARTGARISERALGQREERSPEGIASAALVLWPDMHGTSRSGSLFFGNGNQEESAATAYAGTFLALFLVPLAWCSRRHRAFNVLCAVAIILGIGWCANLPGWVFLLRLRGFNLLSFNRLTFVTGFALVAQTAIGLEALASGACRRSGWFVLPVAAATCVAAFCAWRTHALPEPLATELNQMLAQGQTAGWLRSPTDLPLVQQAFVRGAIFCSCAAAFAACAWACLALRPRGRGWLPIAGLVALGELLTFAHDRVTQSDPALYYPSIPSLRRLDQAASGRVVGFFCLPANIATALGRNDVRGYDPVEPARMTQLLRLGAHPRSPTLAYTSLQWFAPAVTGDSSGRARLPPVLDLLGVRHVICRGSPPPGMKLEFSGDDYWGIENERALPRAFVPAHVTIESDAAARLRRLGAPTFDPKRDAYLETAVNLPRDCSGDAYITVDEPTHVQVAVEAGTKALLVLGDRWDVGWHAYVNRREQPILRTDHALRGVVVSAGKSVVDFDYAPASEHIGWWCAAVALAALSALCLTSRSRRARS